MNYLPNKCFEGNAKRYRSFYMNRFISMRCSVDMLMEGLFPNAKEITESFGAFEATKYLPYDWNDKINVVCVGDGNTPRTAATFAFRTKWDCYSVDPILRDTQYNIRRLTLIPKKIEEVQLSFDDPVVICAVHSHARLDVTLKSIKAPEISIIAIPCCVPLKLEESPTLTYRDENIWSPENEVKIWRKL